MAGVRLETAALQLIAEGVTALAGFEVAAISVVDGAELSTVAVAGDAGAAAELAQIRIPTANLLAELVAGETWGRFTFVPHERSGGHTDGFEWVPEMDVLDTPDAWHPEDLLCALLHDSDGGLRGVLSIDLPRNGRRPDPTQREILDVYAGQAEQAVVRFMEHDELVHDLEIERGISRYRQHLVDVLSHELRTPTAAILGHAELALADQVDPDLRRTFETIVRSARRISAMAEDLLLMARVDNVDRPLDAVAVDLAQVAREAGDLMLDEAVRRGVDLTVVVPGAPVEVMGDADALGTVATNLLSNAIKYSDPGAHVEVTLAVHDEVVELVVADTGIGISIGDQARLFDELFRSASPEARARPGNGLGLAIVDKIVRRHRGEIRVTSALGEGTTFRVELPRTLNPA